METWKDKRVLITGHTGFKGAWLTLWMKTLGANIAGFSLKPDTTPSLFDQLQLEDEIDHTIGDVKNFQDLNRVVQRHKPEFVFHLAAQPLVRLSYHEPVRTWADNVQGTVHVLEAIRLLEAECNIVAITTDKVYENREWVHAYRETDRLGGHDPYSASKAACEIVMSSYRNSFFKDSGVRLASARAGNVIGGGDWAQDRIVPDIVRALTNKTVIESRNPNAVRPWQHVLDPLAGYIKLAEKLAVSDQYASEYNFGPEAKDQRTVKDLIETSLKNWPGTWQDVSSPDQLHEANLLSLTIEKARSELNWHPHWGFETAVSKTIDWYKQVEQGISPLELTKSQIREFKI